MKVACLGECDFVMMSLLSEEPDLLKQRRSVGVAHYIVRDNLGVTPIVRAGVTLSMNRRDGSALIAVLLARPFLIRSGWPVLLLPPLQLLGVSLL